MSCISLLRPRWTTPLCWPCLRSMLATSVWNADSTLCSFSSLCIAQHTRQGSQTISRTYIRAPSPSPSLCGEAGLLHGLLSLSHSLHSCLLSGPAPAQSCLHGDQAVGQPVPVAAEEPLPARREGDQRGGEGKIREGGRERSER